MKVKEIRQLSTDDLKNKVANFRKELFALNYHRKMGTVEKPSRFSLLRKDIARILTIIKEREKSNE